MLAFPCLFFAFHFTSRPTLWTLSLGLSPPSSPATLRVGVGEGGVCVWCGVGAGKDEGCQ